MTVKVNWDRNPVSVHSEKSEELNLCINFLRNRHGLKKKAEKVLYLGFSI